MKGSITVVGLGPATFEYMTVTTWSTIKKAKNLYLRTKKHPTIAKLSEQQIKFSSFDDFYEKAENFETLYEEIVSTLFSMAEKGKNITYAVPGSPLVAEKTVLMLRQNSESRQITLNILPAMSFLDVMYNRLNIDPINGILILDASDEKALPTNFTQGIICTQVYSKNIASNLKLSLMQNLPDNYRIIIAHHLGLADENVASKLLYEFDRLTYIDHLTSVYIPPTK